MFKSSVEQDSKVFCNNQFLCRLGRKTLLVMMMILQGTACIVSTVFTTVANGNQGD